MPLSCDVDGGGETEAVGAPNAQLVVVVEVGGAVVRSVYSFKRGVVTAAPPNKEQDMLILTRRVDEKIAVGDSIVITVVEIRDGKVRLGIDAPKDILILREEIIGTEKKDE